MVPIVIRDLDDEQMLQFMGRENMEDYNSDFLTMLETWDSAVAYFPRRDGKQEQPIDIAKLLGWTQLRKPDSVQMNRTADACHAAHKLLKDGFVKRGDLTDLTIREAREICTRASANSEATLFGFTHRLARRRALTSLGLSPCRARHG